MFNGLPEIFSTLINQKKNHCGNYIHSSCSYHMCLKIQKKHYSVYGHNTVYLYYHHHLDSDIIQTL